MSTKGQGIHLTKFRCVLVSGVAAAALLGGAVAAHAEDYVGNQEQGVLGTEISRAPAAAAPASSSRGGLPVTGGDLAGLAAVGAAAVGSGVVLVRRSRSARA
ncbi:MAG: hypothetical protein QOI20_1004 [Acidimicrobiaceae bacterium]|nr:hypothetical protein [Acidimicrobiaceae bacterium]